jgi:hypothetical protein
MDAVRSGNKAVGSSGRSAEAVNDRPHSFEISIGRIKRRIWLDALKLADGGGDHLWKIQLRMMCTAALTAEKEPVRSRR